MAQPSILQPLGGPLAGQRLEFYGGEASIGSAADCTVRLDLPGVEPHHARITVDLTGAMIYRVDGVVGVNDDVVMGDSLLRSGDFVWIGEPAGPDSIMCQFTLGDGEEAPSEAAASDLVAAPAAAGEMMEVVSEEAPPQAAAAEEVLLEETPVEPAEFAEPAPGPAEFSEPAPEPASELTEAPEPPAEFPEPASELTEAAPASVAEYADPEPVAAYSEPEPAPEPVAEFSEPLSEPEPAPAAAAEPVVVEPPPDLQEMMEVAPEPQAEFDPGETFEPAPAPESATVTGFPPPSPPPTVPPAPWLAPATAPEPAPAAEYASAWESKPAAGPAAVEAPAAPPPPPPPPAPRPAAAARPATPTSPLKRPATPSSKSAIRTVQQDAVLRTPPPPPPGRGTSSTPIIVVGLIAVVLLIGGVMFMRQTPAPAPAPPTPQPTPVAVATPEPTPAEPLGEPTVEATVEPTVEPTPEPAPAATLAGPTPRVPATPRATPTPRTTPTPTPRTAAATPPPAPTAAAPAAPVSPVPRLLEEARAAVNARDLPRAQQLIGEALRAEPGNSEATARKAEVDARVALLGKRFSTGATTVIGGKTAKGPSGFDLGGGGVVKTDFSAQIRCTTTPTSVEPGVQYTVRCSILNIGTKPFRLENVTVNETADGAKTPGAGTTPRGDLAPQSDSVILEKSGTWSAKAWSLEVITKTTKDESFRAVYNWR